MALITKRIDDLDGSETDVTTVFFALDGTEYELDLSAANRDRLGGALERYLQHARRSASPRKTVKTRREPTKTSPSNDIQHIRTWARDNGYKISDRGRVAASIQDAYRAAHES